MPTKWNVWLSRTIFLSHFYLSKDLARATRSGRLNSRTDIGLIQFSSIWTCICGLVRKQRLLWNSKTYRSIIGAILLFWCSLTLWWLVTVWSSTLTVWILSVAMGQTGLETKFAANCINYFEFTPDHSEEGYLSENKFINLFDHRTLNRYPLERLYARKATLHKCAH